MREYDLNKLLEDKELANRKIKEFLGSNVLKKQKIDDEEIKGHILKAEHNLRFISENIKLDFLDWAIIGCYYACYHAALSIILTKGYSSKNHLATICVLIKEFYKKGLNREEIETLSNFIDYQDLLFYVESKNKREEASYSTKTKFNKKEAEQLRLKAVLFINNIKRIMKDFLG
jgi:uncharacterized protein (UPF0332 family)